MSKYDTLILGLEHFIDKIGYQAKAYQDYGIKALYLVQDPMRISTQKAKKYHAEIKIMNVHPLIRMLQTIAEFYRYKPRFCELYDTGRLTFLYALIAKCFRAKLIVFLRGTELTVRNDNKIRYRLLWIVLNYFADHVVAKECNLIEALKMKGFSSSKTSFIGNCIPMPHAEIKPIQSRYIDILFLNRIHRTRHVDLLIKALPIIFEKIGKKKVVIAGFGCLNQVKSFPVDIEEEYKLTGLINDLHLEDKIEIKEFVSNPESYFSEAKLFVFPADFVYANYSLLEAMSYGAVPVVSDGEGSDKIVHHNKNGIIIKRDITSVADAIVFLLENLHLTQLFSFESRKTISLCFDISNWVQQLVSIRKYL